MKLSKMLVRLLRYDYDKHNIRVDRDGLFNMTDVVQAPPLRHFETSQIIERLAEESDLFSINDQTVRIYLSARWQPDRGRTKTKTPDLKNIKIIKDTQTSTDDLITFLSETRRPPVDDNAKHSETHAQVFPTEARIRQKAKEVEQKSESKKSDGAFAGRKTRKKDIEDRRDDCGSNLNSLLPFLSHEIDHTLTAYLN